MIERLLKDDELERFQSMTVAVSFSRSNPLQDGEKLVSCPFCPYFEIRTSFEGAIFFDCQRMKCNKKSCVICKKSCPKLEDGYEDDYDSTTKMTEIEGHFLCAELEKSKLAIEHAVEDGFKIRCPSCRVSGMKDNNCTHMQCSNCGQSWCYFCGRKEEDCPKDDPNGNIFSHNADWPRHLGARCPMYLSELSNRHSWPVDEDACLTLFHRLRALLFLKETLGTFAPGEHERLERHFSSISGSGFTVAEIEQADSRWPELCAIIKHRV